MSNKTKPLRPFSLEYDEAKSKIYRAVNEATQLHGVPCYLLEGVINEVSRQVKEQADLEREQARRTWEKRLTESEGENK
jgi:hypothetical protein